MPPSGSLKCVVDEDLEEVKTKTDLLANSAEPTKLMVKNKRKEGKKTMMDIEQPNDAAAAVEVSKKKKSKKTEKSVENVVEAEEKEAEKPVAQSKKRKQPAAEVVVEEKKKKKTEEVEKAAVEEEEQQPQPKKKKKKAKQSEESTEQPAAEMKEETKKKKKSKEGKAVLKEESLEEKGKSAMSAEQIAEYRRGLSIVVTGPLDAASISPFQSFADLPLPAAVRPVCARFTKPTPIQSQCWPAVLQRRDVIAIAQTGSGKTLGFLLPLLPRLSELRVNSQTKGPFCLILAPTRELVIQTMKVCEEMATPCAVRAISIFGGVPKHPQVADLRKGTHIIAATPGRLLALIEEKHCDLSAVAHLVLDEADRMLDMGFEKDIRTLIAMTSSERQTLLFSATWPNVIQRLASEFVRQPVHITIGARMVPAADADEAGAGAGTGAGAGDALAAGGGLTTECSGEQLVANRDITQIVQVMADNERGDRLHALLNQVHRSRKNRVLIFVLYKKETDQIENLLRRRGWTHAVSISSNKTQADRTAALDAFRAGTRPLLIATDVASRGLDIPDVEYVINYSFPLTIEDYMHRIGRTGRAGKKGHAYTFFTPFNKSFAGQLVHVLRTANQTVPEDLLKFGTAIKKKEHSMYGCHFKASEDNAAPMKKSTRVVFD